MLPESFKSSLESSIPSASFLAASLDLSLIPLEAAISAIESPDPESKLIELLGSTCVSLDSPHFLIVCLGALDAVFSKIRGIHRQLFPTSNDQAALAQAQAVLSVLLKVLAHRCHHPLKAALLSLVLGQPAIPPKLSFDPPPPRGSVTSIDLTVSRLPSGSFERAAPLRLPSFSIDNTDKDWSGGLGLGGGSALGGASALLDRTADHLAVTGRSLFTPEPLTWASFVAAIGHTVRRTVLHNYLAQTLRAWHTYCTQKAVTMRRRRPAIRVQCNGEGGSGGRMTDGTVNSRVFDGVVAAALHLYRSVATPVQGARNSELTALPANEAAPTAAIASSEASTTLLRWLLAHVPLGHAHRAPPCIVDVPPARAPQPPLRCHGTFFRDPSTTAPPPATERWTTADTAHARALAFRLSLCFEPTSLPRPTYLPPLRAGLRLGMRRAGALLGQDRVPALAASVGVAPWGPAVCLRTWRRYVWARRAKTWARLAVAVLAARHVLRPASPLPLLHLQRVWPLP